MEVLILKQRDILKKHLTYLHKYLPPTLEQVRVPRGINMYIYV